MASATRSLDSGLSSSRKSEHVSLPKGATSLPVDTLQCVSLIRVATSLYADTKRSHGERKKVKRRWAEGRLDPSHLDSRLL